MPGTRDRRRGLAVSGFRRKRDQEINLTPLLDVLFVILFILMLSGRENEERLRSQSGQEVAALQEELTRSRTQIAQLEQDASAAASRERAYADRVDSLELYRDQAVVLTAYIEETEGLRELVILDGQERTGIRIEDNSSNYTEGRIRSVVRGCVEKARNQPVFIVFHFSADEIYTYEIRLVERVMLSLQEEYKEVFYKTMREGGAPDGNGA